MTFIKVVYRYLILFLFGFLFLCGCPYDSIFSLSKSSEAVIDREIIGKWQIEDEKKKNSGVLTIYPFNEHEYVILITERNNKFDGVMRAFCTNIDGYKFLNIQKIKLPPKKQKWIFINYSIDNDKLVWKVVQEDIFKTREIKSRKELYTFIKKNLKNKHLYLKNDKSMLKRFHN